MTTSIPCIDCLLRDSPSTCIHPPTPEVQGRDSTSDWYPTSAWPTFETLSSPIHFPSDHDSWLKALDGPIVDDGGHTPGLDGSAEGSFQSFDFGSELDAYHYLPAHWVGELPTEVSSQHPPPYEACGDPAYATGDVPRNASWPFPGHFCAFPLESEAPALSNRIRGPGFRSTQASNGLTGGNDATTLEAVRALVPSGSSPDGFDLDSFDQESSSSSLQARCSSQDESERGANILSSPGLSRKRSAEETALFDHGITKRQRQELQRSDTTARTTPAAEGSQQTMVLDPQAGGEPSTSAREEARPLANKVAMAFLECQARKSKCTGDGNDACSRCLAKGITCQYPDTQRKRGRGRKNIEKELAAIRAEYEELVQQQIAQRVTFSQASALEQKMSEIQRLEEELRQCTGTGTHRARSSANGTGKGKQRAIAE